MPRYLYRYLQLFGYMGAGTPDDPGSDFAMSVWIDAPDEAEARRWGEVLLDDYMRGRYRDSTQGLSPDDLRGEIVKDAAMLENAAGLGYPACKVGEMPTWVDPWRHDNASVQRPPEHPVPLADLITGTILDKLRAFLRTADRETGSSYPSDFDRWCAFLTEAHRKRARFSGIQLERWLMEVEGWPQASARELGDEYSLSRSLLDFYDDETVEEPG